MSNLLGPISVWLEKSGAKNLFSDRVMLELQYLRRFHKRLNLKHPQSFSEKIYWLKLHNRRPEYTMMVDKHAVKAYVGGIIGEEYIIPTYGVYAHFDDIDFDALPAQFVLKCTHDSGSTIVCTDKATFDKQAAKAKLEPALKENFYWAGREWPYKHVKPQIIAEEMLEVPEGEDIVDYKFFCFQGDVEFCQVIADRNTDERIDLYDLAWQCLPFNGLNEVSKRPCKNSDTPHPKPKNLAKMVAFAQQLSRDMPFIRVDFYEVNGQLYFGELTFFPTGGNGYFLPQEWDKKIADLIPTTL